MKDVMVADPAIAKAPLSAPPVRQRRARRSRENVEGCIREAARRLFADRGYAATTTREIAEQADVSETLLFRYFGDKAQLFDAVIIEPFNQVIRKFTMAQTSFHGPDAPDLYRLVFDLLTENRDLLTAIVIGRAQGATAADHHSPSFEPFFQAGLASLNAEYAAAGITPPFDLDIGIRLTFGMMGSAVLMRDWLFPPGDGARDHILAASEEIVRRALRVPLKT